MAYAVVNYEKELQSPETARENPFPENSANAKVYNQFIGELKEEFPAQEGQAHNQDNMVQFLFGKYENKVSPELELQKQKFEGLKKETKELEKGIREYASGPSALKLSMTFSHKLALQLLSKGYKEKYETLLKESPVNLMRLAELNKEHQQIFDGIKVQISAQKELREKLAKLKTDEDRSEKVLKVLTEKPSSKDLDSPEKILEFLEHRTTALRDILAGIDLNKPVNENI